MFPVTVNHLRDEPLARYTTYRIGGPARVLALPKSAEDLAAIGQYLLETKEPYFILGNGSNVLAPDEGFPGVVICTRDLTHELEFLSDHRVKAAAGTLNSRILRACAEKGLGGIEALSGVPGNVGGAVYMNAGTAAGWIDDALLCVEVLSLREGARVIHKADLKYSYREQHYLKPGELIVAAVLQLKPEPAEAVKARLAEAVKKRKIAQPIELPSCGSVFRNPAGHNAWKLVADAGLRGMNMGGARISAKHCNFIVNEGGAKRSDVLGLIHLAKEKVRADTGVELHEEVVLMEPKFL
ncbi:MAG: UDP-N-acetylmuramate dehydrogenase [Proteobacteria bacterium]|nr:MAG: UDP-N-acetylmuramate dehydrogenase [Pseudomonadota bacterium]